MKIKNCSNKIFRVLTFLIYPLILFANPTLVKFVETAGGINEEEGTALVPVISSQSYAVTGWTQSIGSGGSDIFISRFGFDGSYLGTRVFGGTGNDYPNSIIQTADNKFIIVGYTSSTGAGLKDLLISKFDANFNLLWTRVLGGPNNEEGSAVVEVPGGYYITAGLSGSTNLFLVKFDTNGSLVWSKVIYGNPYCCAYSLCKTSGGGLAVAGEDLSFGNRMLLSKLDSSGVVQWTRLLHIAGDEKGSSVIETVGKGLAVAGLTYKSSTATYDIFVTKFDSSGNHLWTKVIDNSRTGIRRPSIIQVNGDSLMVTGYTSYWGLGGDVLLARFDQNGTHAWTRTFGGDSMDCGTMSIMQPSSIIPIYAVAGTSRSWGSGKSDLLIGTFDQEGFTCYDGSSVTSVPTSITPAVAGVGIFTSNLSYTITNWSPIVTVQPLPLFTVCIEGGDIEESGPSKLLTLTGSINSLFIDEIVLRFDTPSPHPLKIFLFDPDGRMILKEVISCIPPYIKLRGRKITELPAGIYFLMAFSGRAKSGVWKLTKLTKY